MRSSMQFRDVAYSEEENSRAMFAVMFLNSEAKFGAILDLMLSPGVKMFSSCLLNTTKIAWKIKNRRWITSKQSISLIKLVLRGLCDQVTDCAECQGHMWGYRTP